MNVSDVMTPDPLQLAPTSSIWEAANLMDTHDIRHLPITDGGVLCGIISDRDIRRFELPFDEAKDDCEKALKRYDAPVSRIMNEEIFSLYLDTSLKEAVDLFISGRFGAIPVVERESNKLLGVVSYIDVLEALKEKL